MNDEPGNKTGDAADNGNAANERDQGPGDTYRRGPEFAPGPDPIAGVKKGAKDVLASMEGKTVSMKVYVGSIIGVVVLMLLARCGG